MTTPIDRTRRRLALDESTAILQCTPATLDALLRDLPHDLDHLMQISRVLARQYADEVRPWRVYLRIMRDAAAES